MSTLQQDQSSLLEVDSDAASWNAPESEPSTVWERALRALSLDNDKREILDEYKKAAMSELIKCGLAAAESPSLDIATLRRAEMWLHSKSAEQAAGSRKRELAGNTAKAVSSITQILSSVGSSNPYVGLACAGLCILTLVRTKGFLMDYMLKLARSHCLMPQSSMPLW